MDAIGQRWQARVPEHLDLLPLGFSEVLGQQASSLGALAPLEQPDDGEVLLALTADALAVVDLVVLDQAAQLVLPDDRLQPEAVAREPGQGLVEGCVGLE